MFEKVIVANRGEIACRVIRTLRRMGVGSVAVFTDADAGSMHVKDADESIRIGSYVDGDAILDAARATGAAAIHPGYGFLSENASFAASCHGQGVTWIGPSPDHLRVFGDKHSARSLAARLGIPLLEGSALLSSGASSGADALAAAVAAAEVVGYPVMLKATSGGGGIGMERCDDRRALIAAYETVARMAERHFGGGGVFLERHVARARHVEVQIFGAAGSGGASGSGGAAGIRGAAGSTVVALGVRDCSAQRRHQKVIEETPPPGLDASLERRLRAWAVMLGSSVGYRSAGTVEFLVDTDRGDAAFLEVNTRLQVEHGITELVTGIDIVEWMVLEAAGGALPAQTAGGGVGDLAARAEKALAIGPGGAAIEVRICAEDPAHGDRPGVGVLTDVTFPPDVRVDTWVERGTEITPLYDPLIAKVQVWGRDRAAAVSSLGAYLDECRVVGVATNLEFLRNAVRTRAFLEGAYPTTFLSTVGHEARTIEVLSPGMQTTVQDLPGRLGYWSVGVPPSGPMDGLGLRIANQLVGNDPSTAALEMTLAGPTLGFETDALIALGGAPMDADLDGAPIAWGTAVAVGRGSTLRIGAPIGGGCRGYLAVRGGFEVAAYLGSGSTFLLGGFGGHAGRALAAGDVLRIGTAPESTSAPLTVPSYPGSWEIGVLDGPHGAPDFFTPEGIEAFFAADWEVHHHSDRTGVRLIGPAPLWARSDGGEAGLHPSNIHDTVYAVGTVDFTGDMPVILGPDGPSLGGFVCPVTVATSELWKVGQLRAGDTVRFVRVARDAPDPVLRRVAAAERGAAERGPAAADGDVADRAAYRPAVAFRRAGDRCVLVEYGPNVLDLALRLRVHALSEAVMSAALPGVAELAPGIRSLQVRYDPNVINTDQLVDALASLDASLGDGATAVPSRVVHLPLSWDDPATRVAIDRYMQVVRDDAPWCPWNIEFIRRINGLGSVDDVRRIVLDASYVVLGLGDVYLGAPVATPLDPRHRLVTTKYNPARTWTPENAVGIGGAYLCVYGMEGPGGYQLVGRTIQMWNRYRETPDFHGSQRWLLRFFDQIRFFPVTADELLDLRRDFAVGRYKVDIKDTTLSIPDPLTNNGFKRRQQDAFDAERARWRASGEFDRVARALDRPSPAADRSAVLPNGTVGVTAPVHGVVARVCAVGDVVEQGSVVVTVEAMKSETSITSPLDGRIVEVRCDVGDMVRPGVPLVLVSP